MLSNIAPANAQEGLNPKTESGITITTPAYEEFDANPIPLPFLQVNTAKNSHLLLIDKSKQDLYLYKYDGRFHRIKTHDCTTGANPGDKRETGDLKTPEGIYFFTDVWEETDLIRQYRKIETAQYAFNTNYPNVIDKMNNKNGYGIWLHASDKPERIKQPYDTKRCIVVRNGDMVDLTPHISLEKTPIIIVKKFDFLQEDAVEQERDRILRFVEAWCSSWESAKIEWYREFYSHQFLLVMTVLMTNELTTHS